jgi:hypothetical protein
LDAEISVALLVGVAQEVPEQAAMEVIGDETEQEVVIFKEGGELIQDLKDTIKELQEYW